MFGMQSTIDLIRVSNDLNKYANHRCKVTVENNIEVRYEHKPKVDDDVAEKVQESSPSSL